MAFLHNVRCFDTDVAGQHIDSVVNGVIYTHTHISVNLGHLKRSVSLRRKWEREGRVRV